ncbi:MAG: flagellar biosynthesis anti-sigma factor FlgM [Acidobacteria bacterium]|nr:flagellar biosynthesis anti-sigma factor FlgM [Acidobacteriota bacterium]
MKINHGYQDSRAASAQDSSKAQETTATPARAARGGAGAGKTAGNDEVNLSSLASALQGALADSPDRAARLDRLAGEYAAGTYNPDPESIAGGIISDSLLDEESKKP